MGGVGHFAAVGHVEVAHGVFQPDCGFWGGDHSFRLLHRILIEDAGKVFAGFGFLHRDPLQPPSIPGAAGKFGPDDARLGHAQAVFCNINGGAGLKNVVAGAEGVPVRFFPLEIGITEMLRFFEEHPKRLRQLVVFLNERLIVYLGQKRSPFLVFGRGGDKMLISLQVKPLLVGQHMVPDIAAAAEGLLEQLNLGFIGVKAGLDGCILDFHAIFVGFFWLSRHPGPPPFQAGRPLASHTARGLTERQFEKVYFCKVQLASRKIFDSALNFQVFVPNK